MGVEVVKNEPDGSPRPLKALGVALLVDHALIVLVLLPPVWPLVLFTIVPYLGGRLGGRYVDKRTATRIGAVAALVMVTVLATVLLSVLASLQPANFDLFEPIGLSVLAAGYLVSMLFGAIGGRHGAAAAME
jgi:hypothetical protein